MNVERIWYISVILFTLLTSSGVQCAPAQPPPSPILSMNDTIDKSSYLPGEVVKVRFSWKNITNEIVTIKPFPLSVEIRRPYDSVVRSYRGGSGECTLEPGEILSHTLTWDQRDNDGRMVEPGYYFLNVEYEAIKKSGLTESGYQPLKILIQFPQGTIHRTINMEQTKTLQDGSQLILKKLVLSPSGAKIFALMVPINYVPPQSEHERIFLGPATSLAYYRLDSSALKSAGSATSVFGKEIELKWDLIDPVPKGARLLTFIIGGISWRDRDKEHKYPGPFEFQVPLE